MWLGVTGRERISGTLGDPKFPLLPASGPTVGRCRGEGKEAAEKNSVVSWPNYLEVVSAYKNCRKVQYYIGWRKTQRNWNYCGSDIFSTMSCNAAMVLTIFVWCMKWDRWELW